MKDKVLVFISVLFLVECLKEEDSRQRNEVAGVGTVSF